MTMQHVNCSARLLRVLGHATRESVNGPGSGGTAIYTGEKQDWNLGGWKRVREETLGTVESSGRS